MQKVLLVVVAVVVGGAFAVVQAATGSGDKKVVICHKTASKRLPYVRLTVSGSSIAVHQKHAADIIPAPRSCPRALLTPTSGGVAFDVTMLGVAEQPEPADADGTGTASIHLRAGQGQVCFSLTAKDVSLPATGAHIHSGTVEEAGPVVVALTAPSAAGRSAGCAPASRAVVRSILANPSGFYVNVHSSDYAAGAIRGQLVRPSTAVLLKAVMTGAQEKPNPADPNGSGIGYFQLFPNTGRLCFTLAVKNILLPATGAHIHRGDGSVAGPVVIPLTAPGASGSSGGCVAAAGALLTEIAGNAGGFYANVHTTQFQGGAVRSQLAVGP